MPDTHPAPDLPLDPGAALQFVVNAASGSSDAQAKGAVIEAALATAQRTGSLHFCDGGELARKATEAAAQARAERSAVVAVGGDGTVNTVAQAAHAAGAVMGVVPQGTFNYFARTHDIPNDPAEAAAALFRATPTPVQVGAINEQLFLVNASLGLYPDLLEDREAYKARFGRSRLVALGAAAVTLLRSQRRLRLRIELGPAVRELRSLTLFVGNNRLQLEQLGMQADSAAAPTAGTGCITAVMLKPIGTLAMLRLMLRGAMGTLGEAPSVEHFEFNHMRVQPTLTRGRRGIKVAYDGEVTRMRAPLEFKVHPQPLWLLKPDRR